jgi:hypothetical protein
MLDIFVPGAKSAFESLVSAIDGVKLVLTGIIDFITGVFTGDWERAWQGLVDIFSGIWQTIRSTLSAPLNAALVVIESFINKIIDGWNWLKKQINSLSIDIPEWLGGGTLGFDLKMSKHVELPRFADGGFPTTGQMFIAREAGAEMVGSIGRKTAVANNDQIVAGIANGVAEANSGQNALLREQNDLLRALLNKDNDVNIDGKKITREIDKIRKQRGATIITGGAY